MVSAAGRHRTPSRQKFPLSTQAFAVKIQIPALVDFNAGICSFEMGVFTGLASRLISRGCLSGVRSSSAISQPSVAGGGNDDSDPTCRAGPYPGDYSTVNSEEPFWLRTPLRHTQAWGRGGHVVLGDGWFSVEGWHADSLVMRSRVAGMRKSEGWTGHGDLNDGIPEETERGGDFTTAPDPPAQEEF